MRDYLAQGTNKPIYLLGEVMSRERYKSIYARIRFVTADPKIKFEVMFERVSICSKYLTSL
jgi:hypothetical protein